MNPVFDNYLDFQKVFDKISHLRLISKLQVKVITWSGGICLIYMHDARGRTASEGGCIYIRQIPTDHVIIIILH